MKNKPGLVVILVIVLVLIVDQVIKIWVKTHMTLGEEIYLIGRGVRIHFTENPGMAFGMKFGGSWGKLALSLFRAIAIAGLTWYVIKLIKEKAKMLFIICISLIIAGAAGNLIDSMFYGLIFNDSLFKVAEMFPLEGGYAGFMYGHVVDMFYCPIINTHYPDWFPINAGEPLVFFGPVFNVADSAITVSVLIMIVFYNRVFDIKPKLKQTDTVAE